MALIAGRPRAAPAPNGQIRMEGFAEEGRVFVQSEGLVTPQEQFDGLHSSYNPFFFCNFLNDR